MFGALIHAYFLPTKFDSQPGKAIMDTPSEIRKRWFTTLAVMGTFTALVGCGDVHTFKLKPGHTESGPPREFAASIDGADIQLQRHSTACSATPSEPLVAKVGDGTEFTAVDMLSFGSSCPDVPLPGIEISLDSSSIIFDFSNVDAPGRFLDTEFDGYVVHVNHPERPFELVYAWVDPMTSVDVQNEDLSYYSDGLDINFASNSYDWTGFLRVNLVFTVPTLEEPDFD